MQPQESAPILTPDEALKLALEALDSPHTEVAEANYKKIVQALEARYGDNQKEVAEELQKLSKQIDSMGKSEQAMEFKQRTTEMMLILSMERRRARGPLPQPNQTMQNLPPQPNYTSQDRPQAPPPTPRRHGDATNTRLKATGYSSATFLKVIYLVQTSLSFENDLNLYTKIMGGRVDWALDSGGKKYRAIHMRDEPIMLLVESDTLPKLLPIFAVSDLEKAKSELTEQGLVEKEELVTPRGQAIIFRANGGISMGIIK